MNSIKSKKSPSLWTAMVLFATLLTNLFVPDHDHVTYAAEGDVTKPYVTGITAGGYHTLALKSDGTVWTWGQNTVGQLGNGTTAFSSTPVQVKEAGTADKTLTNVMAISAKQYHSVALKADGTVWAWGHNAYGQLGQATTTTYRTTAAKVSGLTDVKAISTGGTHTLAVKTDGTVWAWGSNSHGQLGNGANADCVTPVQVQRLVEVPATSEVPAHTELFPLKDIVAVSTGFHASYALKGDGTVWAWGDNTYGQIGDGKTGPEFKTRNSAVQVSGLKFVTSLEAGANHVLALKSDGTVWGWGYNSYGQLGDNSTSTRYTPVQVKLTENGVIQNFDYASKLFQGGYHHFSLILRADGKVWGTGDNRYGQLGNTDSSYSLETHVSIPMQTTGDASVVALTGGYAFSYVLLSDGTVWAMGDNANGMLGVGTTPATTNVPLQVNGL